MPIDPAFSVAGPEWSVGSVGAVDGATDAAAQGSSAGGFAGALGKALQAVQNDQQSATSAVQGLVDGSATDPTQAVMALERARLSMQLAAQVRTKSVEAFQEVFRTQV